MRLLANENLPGAVIDALRNAGHDVLWARTDMTGAKDSQILERAAAEGRLLVTFDKDFGELAFHSRLPATAGIVLFRLTLPSPERAAERVVKILGQRDDWTGHFAVVDETRVRLRDLPQDSG